MANPVEVSVLVDDVEDVGMVPGGRLGVEHQFPDIFVVRCLLAEVELLSAPLNLPHAEPLGLVRNQEQFGGTGPDVRAEAKVSLGGLLKKKEER